MGCANEHCDNPLCECGESCECSEIDPCPCCIGAPD